MKRSVAAVIAVILVIALAGLGAWYFLNPSKPYGGTPESIVVGLPSPAESSALLYIADEQHYFAANGLNVTLKEYDTGIHAVNDMLANKTPDIAVAAEFIIVGKAFEHEKVQGIGAISRQQIFYLVARKDHGIENVSDLKGKRIGVTPGTIAGFYLGRYLELHNIDLQDVTLVDTLPAQFEDAIGNGTVDAVSVWGTYVNSIEDRLGSNTVVWPDQSGQNVYWTAITTNDWAAQHPELITRFLKSLDDAAKYAAEHPAEAKAILKERMGVDDAYIAKVWSNSRYSISLDQSLIIAMEDEGRWMINNNLTTEKAMPDYTDYLYLKGLEDVKPEAVSIIH
jgi:ABC-type nitrate/sulfonate/bicarbonate transport system substrate-binding protein